MGSEHPLAQTLLAHLKAFRGAWISKLTPSLRDALDATGEADDRRKATALVHGSAVCSQGHTRPVHRINEGWQFCGNGYECPCRMVHNNAASEATNLERRGVTNAAKCEQVKQRTRETCRERYGVETAGASIERQQKAKATNLERYGAENVFASKKIRAAIKRTIRAAYGVDHISLSPNHQASMRDGVNKKFGVDNVAQHESVREKITRTNQARYGGNSPAASLTVRRKMKRTMNKRFGGHMAQQHIAEQHRIMGEDDFRARFTGRRANDIAAETGYHPSMIHRYAVMWDVDLDYTVQSRRGAENDFGEQLAALGVEIVRNRRLLIPLDGRDRRDHLEIDFYFPSHKLGVEFHGAYWHSEACGKSRTYHADKLALASTQGIRLLQVFEDEWLDHPDAVVSAIRHRLGLTSDRVFARKCSIAAVTHDEAVAFYDVNHVYGGVNASVHVGLRAGDVLVACMSFTVRGHGRWDLVRYASSMSVVGGASRLLRWFEMNFNWTTITSFVDLRWSSGELYEVLGFQVDCHYGPDYSYVIGNRRFHKANLRKGGKRFRKYDASAMTEREMAEAEGITRVYDAGKLRVVKRHEPPQPETQ